MTRGTWFLKSFAASIRLLETSSGLIRVIYHDHLQTRCCVRPASVLADRVINRVFRRETCR